MNFDDAAIEAFSSSSSSLIIFRWDARWVFVRGYISILLFSLPGSLVLGNKVSLSKRSGSVYVSFSQRPKESSVWVPTDFRKRLLKC